MEALVILITALLADNLLLTRLFGVESLFTATQKPSGAALYGGLVTLVTVTAGTVVLLINNFVLVPLKITFFRTFVSVIVITLIICVIQLISSSVLRKLNAQIESALPLISGNCVVLGSILLSIESSLPFGMSLLYLLFAGIGFSIVMLVFSSIMMKIEVSELPECIKGVPVILISCALVAMAFSGFFGISF